MFAHHCSTTFYHLFTHHTSITLCYEFVQDVVVHLLIILLVFLCIIQELYLKFLYASIHNLLIFGPQKLDKFSCYKPWTKHNKKFHFDRHMVIFQIVNHVPNALIIIHL